MTKLKKVPRKKLTYTKRRQQSRRTMKSRKSRKLMGKTRNRKYKMRGGLKLKLVELLAALFAVAKVENPGMYRGQTIGPQEQLEYAIENKNHLLDEMKDENSPIYTMAHLDFNKTKDLDLSSILGDMQDKPLDKLLQEEINIDAYTVPASKTDIENRRNTLGFLDAMDL